MIMLDVIIDNGSFDNFAVWFVTAISQVGNFFIDLFTFIYLLPQFLPQPFRGILLMYLSIFLIMVTIKVVRGE